MKRKHLLVFILMSVLAACTDDNSEITPGTEDARDKFTGSWLCDEGSGTPFTIEISKLSGDEINIKNFSGYGEHGNAKCIVSGNSLTIPFQDINDLSIVVNASGTGIYSKTGSQEKIKMSYTVDSIAYNNVICTK